MKIKAKKFHRRDELGTVMILVVAVLALLAIIGTVYIVAARSSRNSSSAMETTANLNLSREAIVNMVRTAMLNSNMDANGDIGGSAVTGSYGTLAARNYDYPEFGAGNTSSPNTTIKNEPWLCVHLHNQSTTLTVDDTTANDVSVLTSLAFDPATGKYDLGNTLFPLPAAPTTPNNMPNANALATVVGDQTPSGVDGTPDDPTFATSTGTVLPDSYINLLPFSDASGQRIRFGARIIDTNRMANLNTGNPNEGLSDPNGTYFTSLRLAPSNMNSATDNYFYTADSTPINLHQASTASGNGRAGFSGTGATGNGTFSYLNWQTQMLRYELPSDTAINLFDLSDELELRAYGEFGTNYHIRAATLSTTSGNLTIWPNTLGCAASTSSGWALNATGGSVYGNPRRRNYTTYSFSRELRPYTDPAQTLLYTCTPNGGPSTTPWPFFNHPASATASGPTINRVPVNLSLNDPGKATPDPTILAQLATAVASSMLYTSDNSYVGPVTDYTGSKPFAPNNANPNSPSATAPNNDITPFTQDEICAFAVNYIESRWSGMIQDPNIRTTSAYYLPAGPSFIDSTGICIRSSSSATGPAVYSDFGGGANDLKASGSNVYLAFAAQPYINEIAINATVTPPTPPSVTPIITIKDIAVELYNPYSHPLSLTGFMLKVGTQQIKLDGYSVPTRQFLVVMSSGGTVLTPGGALSVPGQITIPPAGNTVTLYRSYAPRGKTMTSGPQYAAIDKSDFTPLVDPTTSKLTTLTPTMSWSRYNVGGVTVSNWGAAYESTAGQAPSSLGTYNNPPNPSTSSFPIYDRYAGSSDNSPTTSQTFLNINDFNHTMRICNVIDSTGESVAALADGSSGLLPQHLYQLQTSANSVPPFSSMQIAGDARVYFDFKACPEVYNPTATTVNSGKPGDIRAIRLLDQLAFIDRASDASIDVGYGTTDINKIRIPGQINVNTASGSVLRAIASLNGFSTPDVLVANILGYRARLAAGAATYNGQASTINYSDQTKYPGYGIRSLEEFMVPVNDYAAASAQSLLTRDTLWASLYNTCTVRSDTFAVYGYLEAVRQNPAYTGGFTNSTEWYGTVTDNPHDVNGATIPLLRVSKRRFIAILDRSWCNYPRSDSNNFTLPRVVAIKDLPQ